MAPDERAGRIVTPLVRLVRAVEAADAATASEMLDADPTLVHQPVAAHTVHGHGTLLHLAMPGDGRELLPGHVEVVSLLLKHGARVDALGEGPNHGVCTPLSLAAWGGHVPLVELLLEHGANPNGHSAHSGKQPLRTAARHGHQGAVEALIRAGADYEFLDVLVAGLTPRVVAHLDSHPQDINARLRNGSRPVHAALDREMQNGATLVSLLLERGADPSLRDARGRTALHVAIQLDNQAAIEVLRARNGPLDLFAAAGLAEREAAAKLIRANPACADEKQADGVTPLFFAAHAGASAIARALLEAGAHPSPRSDRFWACVTPLHLALRRDRVDVVRILLNCGADANACGSDPNRFQPTPLHVAARWNGIEVVRLLLDHGADPCAGGASALDWALYADQADVLRLFFDRGLDREHVNTWFSLHKAAAYGHADLVRLLLEKGADPYAKDRDGRTPKEVASAHGRTRVEPMLA